MTADGRKPIEDVTVGERVMARDELSGETELRTVEHVIVRNDREVFELTFADGEQREVISVTSDHRFHTTERGWVVSAELQIGEAIESLDGRRLVFETRSAQARKAPTFNLSVAEDHNYFVGESGLWVHNCTPCGLSPDAYVAGLPQKRTPTGGPEDQFEIEQTGPMNYRVPAGNETFDIDGYEGNTILDAKYVGNPGRSPFIHGSKAPSFLREKIRQDQLDEFRRVKVILNDSTNPFTDFEVRTNDSSAAAYFRDLLREQGLPDRVKVVTTEVGARK